MSKFFLNLMFIALVLFQSTTGLCRIYSPSTGRFLSQEPTGQDGPNYYWALKNNPLRYTDPTGLSAEDVRRIEGKFNQTVHQMKLSGERSSGNGWANGAMDNVSRLIHDVGGPGRPFLACGEQAEKIVTNMQEIQKLDDQWFFETDQFGAFHQTGFGYSSNPTDPILIMDPWANKFTKLPRE